MLRVEELEYLKQVHVSNSVLEGCSEMVEARR